MPAPSSTKRVRGTQIYRPFTFGSEAIPFSPDPSQRPRDAPSDHTHRWRVFVRGVPIGTSANGTPIYSDVTHWLRKVQFKLHDTYANSVRMVESPPFQVEETGWGEFEVAIKFYFVPESGEKPQQLWHALKLHPYGVSPEEAEVWKRERRAVKSICYEEVVFSEPVEGFYDVLTGGGEKATGAKAKKSGEKSVDGNARTAEIPIKTNGASVWSREEESKELDRLGEAVKKVEKMIAEEKENLREEELRLQELQETEGKVVKKR
ncbi:NuA4 histone H4 acetyltransferase complex and the SWR1 complex subunit [Neophaeococcomyces mojaviensis]|uniref:NuA4 histone H4 acetyltransferase complex and the SWR1 complex subunit n=1 Tax=Neophaeococcomyces mojaviensis TaxID=3383035 RepID=A0ACC2ZVB3_9EURO|nr:NuA4 histone H4 acetyltransferase complex and the SWR1 complex subunit [Knufia sp. JES_112]